MSGSEDIVARLYDLYWCTDMNERAMRAEMAGEAAQEIKRLRSCLENARNIIRDGGHVYAKEIDKVLGRG